MGQPETIPRGKARDWVLQLLNPHQGCGASAGSLNVTELSPGTLSSLPRSAAKSRMAGLPGSKSRVWP